MKKFSKLIAALLCLVMALSMAACGGKTDTPATGNNASSGSGASGEIPTVKVAFTATMDCVDNADVTEQMNVMLRERYGVQVEMVQIGFGDLATKIPLMLTGSDELDLFTNIFTPMTISSMVANGQILALDDLLAQYGQGIMASGIDQFFAASTINGKLYGIPTNGAFATMDLYLVRKDVSDAVLAELGWKESDVKDYESLTTFMVKGREMFPEYYFVPGSTAAGAWYTGSNTGTFDFLGVPNNLVALMDPANSTQVTSYFASEEFQNACKYAKLWKEKDLIIPDAMSQSEALKAQMQYGRIAGTHSGDYSAANNAATYTNSFGFECVAFSLSEPYTVSTSFTNNWCINANSKHPDAAMKVLNAFYTDADIANLLMNGREGKEYEVHEDGRVFYPEGQNISTVGWTTGAQWIFPNQMLSVVWEPNPLSYYEDMRAAQSSAVKSKAIGFVPDTESVTNQIASCVNVANTYAGALLYGEADMDTTYARFMEDLEAAGINDIVAEIQSQLNAFLG